MQIESTGQAQALVQTQQTQLRKMDGSGNGQGNRSGSNCTTGVSSGSLTQQRPDLYADSTFSMYA